MHTCCCLLAALCCCRTAARFQPAVAARPSVEAGCLCFNALTETAVQVVFVTRYFCACLPWRCISNFDFGAPGCMSQLRASSESLLVLCHLYDAVHSWHRFGLRVKLSEQCCSRTLICINYTSLLQIVCDGVTPNLVSRKWHAISPCQNPMQHGWLFTLSKLLE